MKRILDLTRHVFVIYHSLQLVDQSLTDVLLMHLWDVRGTKLHQVLTGVGSLMPYSYQLENRYNQGSFFILKNMGVLRTPGESQVAHGRVELSCVEEDMFPPPRLGVELPVHLQSGIS